MTLLSSSNGLSDWNLQRNASPGSIEASNIHSLPSKTIDEHESSRATMSVPYSTSTDISPSSKGSAILGDGSFEAKIRERTKQRKEKEDLSIAELRVCMADMERSLGQETKKRIEGIASLELLCTEKVSNMEQRLNEIIDRRVSSVQDRLNLIEAKVQDLNLRLEEEKIRIPADIERMGKEIQLALRSLQEDFVMERNERMERENRIMKRVTDHAMLMEERWGEERNERTLAVQNIQKLVKENQQYLCEDHEGGTYLDLQSFVGALERERHERIMEDEEIIQALHRYTEKLEASLSIISGDE